MTLAPAAHAAEDLADFLGGAKAGPVQVRPLPEGSRVLLAPKAKVWNPVWHTDGRTIACLANHGGDAVWLVDVQTGAAQRITRDPAPKSSLGLLAGDRWLYVSGTGSARTVHLLAADGSRDEELAVGWNAAPSADGQAIAFDTPLGPQVARLDARPLQPRRLPLPELKTVGDAFPRFVTIHPRTVTAPSGSPAGPNGRQVPGPAPATEAVVFAQEGHVYLVHLPDGKLERIAERNMQDLAYFVFGIPSPDGAAVALFSTNAAALSKPASTCVVSLAGDRRPREVSLGKVQQWLDSDTLLLLQNGQLCTTRAVPGAQATLQAARTTGGSVSPDGKRLAFEFAFQDTNGDGQVDWRDGTSLLLKDLLRP